MIKRTPQPPSIEDVKRQIKNKNNLLRDDIAIKVLASLSTDYNDYEALCKAAYEIAEQMMKERQNYL